MTIEEMVSAVMAWGVQPRLETGDSWYSGLKNLKFIRNQKLGFLFRIEKNRTVSNEPRKYCQVGRLEISDEGLMTHLKEFGFLRVVYARLQKRRLRTLYFLPPR